MEIIADILTEALNGASKTRVMYRANLNFSRVNHYFSELLEKDLIFRENGPNKEVPYYRTTEKGKDLLRVLKNARDLISI